jgi:hypothetical protein
VKETEILDKVIANLEDLQNIITEMPDQMYEHFTKHLANLEDLQKEVQAERYGGRQYHLIYTLKGEVINEEKNFQSLAIAEQWLESIGADDWQIGMGD